jgi:hypothetical protein
MKTLKNAALVLGICLFSLPQARASAFLDTYGGFSKFSSFDATQSTVRTPATVPAEANSDYPNSQSLDSYVAGFRAGNTWKTEHVNLSLAYDNSFYNVGATPIDAHNGWVFAGNGGGTGTIWKDSLGGLVWQPGVDFLVGVPLRYFRAYVGYGLIVPVMFYNYTTYDKSAGTYTTGQTGTSGAIGHHFLFGGRWFITKHLNLMIEDRIQSLFTPLVIKDSVYSPNTKQFYNSSFTFMNLPANQLLVGIGFAWGD